MNYRALVRLMPRSGILDPQGQAVESALHVLGFTAATEVHVGKAITLTVRAGSKAEAERQVRAMCDKLLANPVTEDYLVSLEEG